MTNTQNPRLGAFYGRTAAGGSEGIENQLKVAREVAALDGYTIPDGPEFVYTDVNVSGLTTSRGGLDRLRKDITEGKAQFDRVYVREPSRLGRWQDPRRFYFLEVLFEEHGVDLRFCDRKHIQYSEGVDCAALGNFILESVESVRASLDHTDLSKKMVARKRELALDAFRAGGAVPYGFDVVLVEKDSRRVVRTLQPGERTQDQDCHRALRPAQDRRSDAVRLMFEGVEQGHSIRRICSELNAGMFPPPSKDGVWRPSTVMRMLRHPVYMGTLTAGNRRPDPGPNATVTGRETILVHDAFPDPPISSEQFARVQEILAGVRS